MKRFALACLAFAALAAPASADIAGRVDDFGWMAGSWTETRNGITTRESWLGPLGGVMGGVGQTYKAGQNASVEFMRITTEKSGPTFTAMPTGQKPTAFVLKAAKATEAVFENLGHDFPQRVIYRRCGTQRADLCARIEGMIGGKLQGQDWHYTRIRQ